MMGIWLIGRVASDGAKQFLDEQAFTSQAEADAYITAHKAELIGDGCEVFAFGPVTPKSTTITPPVSTTKN